MTMLHSLRLRLVLVLVLVALIPAGAVSVLIYWTTAEAFRNYAAERSLFDAQSVVNQVGESTGGRVVVTGSSDDVLADSFAQSVTLNDPASVTTYENPAPVAGAEPAVAESGSSVSAPLEALNASGGTISTGGQGATTIAATGGSSEGSVSGPGTAAGGEDDGLVVSLPGIPDQEFLDDVTRSMLIAAGVAAGGALLLALLLARHVVQPVEQLTAAAHGMAAGDLKRRVTVHSRNEIGVLASAFNTMADNRARLETLRRNMVNDVAHELRTPLSNLQGYLEVLRDGLTPPTPEVLATLHEESLSLNRLVADLQELALAEAGQLPLVRAPLDLAGSVETAIEAFSPQATAHDLSLVSNVPASLPMVLADGARLGQILRNLLKNAIVHTPPAGRISVDAATSEREIAVSVRDSGPGIAPEHLPYVFDRFYRADAARSRATGGAGLGLAIVKHLVEAQGGRINASSEPGAGTTVTFTLPRADAIALERAPVPA